MWLEVRDFRNLEGIRLSFQEPVTLFFGDNAQGKTNLLEAIHFLGTTRSFREGRLPQVVREGAGEARLRGGVTRSGVSHDVEVRITATQRDVARNGASCTPADYWALMPVVVLSAEDRELVHGDPAGRRRFVDGTWARVKPAHLSYLREFARCLRQRNRVLAEYRASRKPELEAWTKVFTEASVDVRRERELAVRRIGEKLRDLGKELDIPEPVDLAYRPSGGENLREEIQARLSEEIGRGHTLRGPHRDGVEIRLSGRPIHGFGSAGQVRTALWVLKLAQLLLIQESLGDPGLFLLDDVESELDGKRMREMVRMTEGRAQLFLTATGPLESGWGPMARFRIGAGEAYPYPSERSA